MANYYVLLTDHGKSFIANAQANSQLALTYVVLGDANDQPYLPESRLNQTKLVHQTAKLPVASVKVINETTAEVSAVVPSNVGGFNVHEIGITDSSGKLVYVGNFHGGYRPTLTEGAGGDMELVITITADNLATVVIEMDGNVVSATRDWVNERFQLLLRTLIPYGYLYHTHTAVNPKPLFDELLGTDTQWRRIEGQTIVATDPDDTYISDIGIVLGQKGMTNLANAQRPNVYPLRTTHIYERYDPSTVVETVWKVVANKTSINEGDAVRFTITANNLPDGQILNWTIKEGTLNSASNDITSADKTESGTVILNNGQAVINFTTTSDDNETEPQKHVRLTVGAPANLSINVPVNDAGHNETVVHISQSTTDSINLAEYYKAQYGAYPSAGETVRFIVDDGVDIIAPNTATPALTEGANWPAGNIPTVENHGRILGRGGNGGRSACIYVVNDISGGGILSAEKGGDGGTAIKGNIAVENYSLVAGGGGGGGGMGAGYGSSAGFIGGGGAGGGAPFGKADLNANTYPKYLEDDTMPAAKVAIPNDGRTYFELMIYKDKVNLTATDSYDTFFDGGDAGDPATFATYNRQVMYISIIRWIDEAAGTYNVGNPARYSYPVMQMSQDAGLESGGLAGYGGGYGGSYLLPYQTQYGRDPSLNHGGAGGDIGESGSAGIITQWLNNTGGIVDESAVENKVPSQSGGLAGYIKEGNVTITNYSSGITKGR
ncbi:phage tail-collar fiber domain-containing protein [Psychrobacter celer]|uniref:phage tail-collar fiber domain-containing protein n=1 Tax=Psychrobacter celer TaxID=306572 RepID=UPI003FD34D86